RVVGGNADHHHARLLELTPPVAESACLLRTPWRVVLRIEVQDQVLAVEVLQRDALARCVIEREVGSRLAFHDRHEVCLLRTGRCHTGRTDQEGRVGAGSARNGTAAGGLRGPVRTTTRSGCSSSSAPSPSASATDWRWTGSTSPFRGVGASVSSAPTGPGRRPPSA